MYQTYSLPPNHGQQQQQQHHQGQHHGHAPGGGLGSKKHAHKRAPQTKVTTKNHQNTSVRAGDWVCLLCHNLNFSFRNECNRCQMQTKKENHLQNLMMLQSDQYAPQGAVSDAPPVYVPPGRNSAKLYPTPASQMHSQQQCGSSSNSSFDISQQQQPSLMACGSGMLSFEQFSHHLGVMNDSEKENIPPPPPNIMMPPPLSQMSSMHAQKERHSAFAVSFMPSTPPNSKKMLQDSISFVPPPPPPPPPTIITTTTTTTTNAVMPPPPLPPATSNPGLMTPPQKPRSSCLAPYQSPQRIPSVSPILKLYVQQRTFAAVVPTVASNLAAVVANGISAGGNNSNNVSNNFHSNNSNNGNNMNNSSAMTMMMATATTAVTGGVPAGTTSSAAGGASTLCAPNGNNGERMPGDATSTGSALNAIANASGMMQAVPCDGVPEPYNKSCSDMMHAPNASTDPNQVFVTDFITRYMHDSVQGDDDLRAPHACQDAQCAYCAAGSAYAHSDTHADYYEIQQSIRNLDLDGEDK